MRTEIGVIGLGVMGKSLSRNLARNNFSLSIYNRHLQGEEENIAVDCKNTFPELAYSLAFDDLSAFVESIERPRKIILMVHAGVVDSVLTTLSPLLSKEDIVIDGGNSHYLDTNRRMKWMGEQDIHFIGAGISGGEEGALTGPSIMPSGHEHAYKQVSNYLESIAAKDMNGQPCCTYVGREGSGHFVKIIHNGIEYAEMQLIAECYAILKRQGMNNEEMANIFEDWMSDLSSYLLGITVDILRKKEGDEFLLDKILDQAGNKGTGKWATTTIADSGQPATMIPAALFARYLSFFKEARERYSQIYSTENLGQTISNQELKQAYQFGRIINHHQGFSLIHQISEKHEWKVNLSEIARIWTKGCIIQSEFMNDLVAYFQSTHSLLSHPSVQPIIQATSQYARQVATACIQNEIHAPCFIEAVNFFHGLKTRNSAANLIQAQRDYFGAHTYQRKDDPSGKKYHTEW